MPLERPPRTHIDPRKPAADTPATHGSTTRLKAPEPPRRASSTWVVRSTVEDLPSFAEDESPSTDTIVGLGMSEARDVPLPRTFVAPPDAAPASRVPTVIPRAERFLEVLEAAMAL